MTIPVPTIDQFNETTVMTVIRNVVDYIIGLVPQINNGDITDMSMNYQGSTLTINLIKGDGTQISKNVTIESGGGETNPYPTDVSLSLSGSTLNCDILLSDNNHVTGTVDLSPLIPSVTGFVTEEELQQVQSDLQEQITGLKLSTSNNNMTLNGDSVQIVKSVTTVIDGNNLTIGVNGVNSNTITLPESGGAKKLTSEPITNFVTATVNNITVLKEFDIEYAYNDDYLITCRCTISKGTYTSPEKVVHLGYIVLSDTSNHACYITNHQQTGEVFINMGAEQNPTQITTENVTATDTRQGFYKLFV